MIIMGHVKYSLAAGHACLELFEVLVEEMNLIGGGTFKNKIIGFQEIING